MNKKKFKFKLYRASASVTSFLIISSAFLFTFLFVLDASYNNAFGAGIKYRSEYDPADLKLNKIEQVHGEPFSASIKNLITGREFEYFTGDYIGSLEVYKIESMQVELRHRLSRQRYLLSLPIDKVNKYAESNYKDEAVIYYEQAVLCYKTGESSSAIELLKKAVQKRNGYEDALFFAGYIFHENNYYTEAYDYYTQVMVVNPRNYKCLYNMAEILAINSKINEAVFTLKKCLKIRPDYDKALALLNKINDELEYKRRAKIEASQGAAARAKEIDTFKKTLTQYAENIKQLEEALKEAKKNVNKTEITHIEAELSRFKLLYNNNSEALEEKLKK